MRLNRAVAALPGMEGVGVTATLGISIAANDNAVAFAKRDSLGRCFGWQHDDARRHQAVATLPSL